MSVKEIAIVDDEKHILETVSFALKKSGFNVAAYEIGKEALQSFRSKISPS